MSKVEGGGGPIDPPSRLLVAIFSRRLIGLTWYSDHCKESEQITVACMIFC